MLADLIEWLSDGAPGELWRFIFGDLPGWIGAFLTIGGSVAVGGYRAALARARLEDRRELLQLAHQIGEVYVWQWTRAGDPHDPVLTDRGARSLIERANSVARKLPHAERVMVARMIEKRQEDAEKMVNAEYALRIYRQLEKRFNHHASPLPQPKMDAAAIELQEWADEAVYERDYLPELVQYLEQETNPIFSGRWGNLKRRWWARRQAWFGGSSMKKLRELESTSRALGHDVTDWMMGKKAASDGVTKATPVVTVTLTGSGRRTPEEIADMKEMRERQKKAAAEQAKGDDQPWEN